MLYDPHLIPITEFSGDFRFLSNFHRAPIIYHGMSFPTVEHAYQAAKSSDPADRRRVQQAKTPGEAKRIGRHIHLRSDWEDVKLDIMLQLLRQKFTDRVLKSQLLATGQRELVEGNYWGDTFWGRCGEEGENHLGKLLMKVREELRS